MLLSRSCCYSCCNYVASVAAVVGVEADDDDAFVIVASAIETAATLVAVDESITALSIVLYLLWLLLMLMLLLLFLCLLYVHLVYELLKRIPFLPEFLNADCLDSPCIFHYQ